MSEDINPLIVDAELSIDGDVFDIKINDDDYSLMKAACLRVERRRSQRRFDNGLFVIIGAFIGFWAANMVVVLGWLR